MEKRRLLKQERERDYENVYVHSYEINVAKERKVKICQRYSKRQDTGKHLTIEKNSKRKGKKREKRS